jgi:hypothetical protein
MTQRLSPVRLERMHTVLGGYIDRGEMPGLVAVVSRGEEVRVVELPMNTERTQCGGLDVSQRVLAKNDLRLVMKMTRIL